MSSPKVLHLYSSVNAGGGMLFVQAILQAMQADGLSPHIALRPTAALAARLPLTIGKEGLSDTQIHPLPLRNGLDVYSMWKLAQIIRRENIQIIHAHTGRDYALAFVLAKWLRRKCVFHRHYFRVSANPVTRWFFRHSDFVITVNQQLRTDYIRAVGLEPERVSALPNWYELPSQSINPAERSLQTRGQAIEQKKVDALQPFVVSMAGNINRNKGQHAFIAAAKIVLATEANCLFQIIGVNSDNEQSAYYQELLASVAADGLQAKIVFLPWQDSIAEHYTASDVWVVPSRNEAFGRVAIEAMWHQVPVIVSRVGGLQEIVQHDETGLLYDPIDDMALAANIQALLDDAAQRQRLVDNATRHVQRWYSKPVVLQQLYANYQAILAA